MQNVSLIELRLSRNGLNTFSRKVIKCFHLFLNFLGLDMFRVESITDSRRYINLDGITL